MIKEGNSVTMTLRYKSAADYVTDRIQQLILNGELESGARIDQIALATQLDVSRHPVRQAIERLAERGFVHISPHKSATVAKLSIDDMEQLYALRAKLERWALELSWPRIVKNKQALEETYRALGQTDPGENMDAYMNANRNFHLAMYDECGNAHLLRMIVVLFDLSERYQRTALRYSSRSARSRQDHTRMMEAVLAENENELARLIDEHNSGTKQTVRDHLE